MRREDLTEAAQGIYEEELTSRGLARPASATEDEEEDPEAAAAAGGGLVSIAKYDSLEEGRFARNLLRNEGIPAWFAGELALRRGIAILWPRWNYSPRPLSSNQRSCCYRPKSPAKS